MRRIRKCIVQDKHFNEAYLLFINCFINEANPTYQKYKICPKYPGLYFYFGQQKGGGSLIGFPGNKGSQSLRNTAEYFTDLNSMQLS